MVIAGVPSVPVATGFTDPKRPHNVQNSWSGFSATFTFADALDLLDRELPLARQPEPEAADAILMDPGASPVGLVLPPDAILSRL